MSEDKKADGCVATTAGPIIPKATQSSTQHSEAREVTKMHVTVGNEAPDFEAAAYHEGGFKNVKLSDYRKKWVFLCFYPGDFTFV